MFNELYIRTTHVPICVCVRARVRVHVCVCSIQLQPQLEYVKIPVLVFQENPMGSSWGFTNRKHDEANRLIYAIV